MGLTYAVPADAHCYRFWFYKTPQRCDVAKVYRVAYAGPRAVVLPHVLPPDHNDRGSVVPIPLPDMSKESIEWGGAMDTELELSLQRQKAIRQLTQEGD